MPNHPNIINVKEYIMKNEVLTIENIYSRNKSKTVIAMQLITNKDIHPEKKFFEKKNL